MIYIDDELWKRILYYGIYAHDIFNYLIEYMMKSSKCLLNKYKDKYPTLVNELIKEKSDCYRDIEHPTITNIIIAIENNLVERSYTNIYKEIDNLLYSIYKKSYNYQKKGY